jgi:hypothetical protein
MRFLEATATSANEWIEKGNGQGCILWVLNCTPCDSGNGLVNREAPHGTDDFWGCEMLQNKNSRCSATSTKHLPQDVTLDIFLYGHQN